MRLTEDGVDELRVIILSIVSCCHSDDRHSDKYHFTISQKVIRGQPYPLRYW